MAKNRYTRSKRLIVNSKKELIEKLALLKRAGKPLFVALIKTPENFPQELPLR